MWLTVAIIRVEPQPTVAVTIEVMVTVTIGGCAGALWITNSRVYIDMND